MRLTKQSPEFKSLKMKYFWQQKFTELSGLIAFIFVPYFFDLLSIKLKFGLFYWEGVVTGGVVSSHWLSGALSLLVIGLVVYLIHALIISNLDKADERASKELGLK